MVKAMGPTRNLRKRAFPMWYAKQSLSLTSTPCGMACCRGAATRDCNIYSTKTDRL